MNKRGDLEYLYDIKESILKVIKKQDGKLSFTIYQR